MFASTLITHVTLEPPEDDRDKHSEAADEEPRAESESELSESEGTSEEEHTPRKVCIKRYTLLCE